MNASMTGRDAERFVLARGRYNRTKPSTVNMTLSSFTFVDGRDLTIELKSTRSSGYGIWLEDGNWLSEDAQIADIDMKRYQIDAPRQSNIKKLNAHKPMIRFQVMHDVDLARLLAAYENVSLPRSKE